MTFRENICLKTGRKLIVFDEIQKINKWDKFIRTLYEKDTDIEIILTGSNSEMLSSELSSNLSGRFIEFNVTPFSFSEYLEYHKIQITDKKYFLRQKKEIHTAFNNYLLFGGLPETFEINTHDAKLSYCQGIVTKIILDDVVKRFKVENVDMLEKLFRYIIAECGKQVSFHNLCKYLKQIGIQTKVETVIKYISYLHKAFALIEINKFDWSQKKIFSGQKKFYSIDTGLISIYRKINENYSFRLENLVALELKRRSSELYYGKNSIGKEIDFISQHNSQWSKFQVCQEINENNIHREISVFNLSDKYLSGNNYLLTLSDSGLQMPSGVFETNLIEWLLGIHGNYKAPTVM
jgi:predicted AAA+ superfamily ATPase